jgi:hypothetical protein
MVSDTAHTVVTSAERDLKDLVHSIFFMALSGQLRIARGKPVEP